MRQSRVLRAAVEAGVGRVVLTSSADAIVHDGSDPSAVRTESSWTDPEQAAPYPKSKTLAERAAWTFAKEHGLDLVVVNPGLVLGPLQQPGQAASMEVVRLLLARGTPLVPKLQFAIVDVRDVARAQRLALQTPDAGGKRFILAGESLWMGEIAEILAATYRPRGYGIPTRALPYWLMWLNARVDGTVRLALTYYGASVQVSAARAETILGWSARPAAESILAAAESLLEQGVVARSRQESAG